MANTIARLTRFIIISSIDSDWVDNQSRYIDDITFVPGAADDILVLREGSITGSKIVSMKSIDNETRYRYFKKKKIQNRVRLRAERNIALDPFYVFVLLTSSYRRGTNTKPLARYSPHPLHCLLTPFILTAYNNYGNL